MEQESESGFRSCTKDHTRIVGSIYLKNRVPIAMFEKKSNGKYYTTCSDCRKYMDIKKK